VRNFAGWGLLVTVALAFLVVSLFVSPRRLLAPLKSALRLVFRAFGLRVRLVGLRHLDPARTYLFVFNHTNARFLITPFLLAHLPGYFVG
jgi:1-acyl-sn-glycerol-3-phosphate acyltransferase